MKNTKISLMIIIIGTITFAGGLFVYSTMSTLGTFEWAMAGVVFALVIFSVIVGMRKYRKESLGQTTEDELSKTIKEKAASRAFAYSFYTWTMLLIFTMDTSLAIEIIIGIGLLLMSILFLGLWGYYSKHGIENQTLH